MINLGFDIRSVFLEYHSGPSGRKACRNIIRDGDSAIRSHSAYSRQGCAS